MLFSNTDFGAGPSNCVLCEAGTYSSREGVRQCSPCDAGFYCPESGMMDKIDCPAGSYCPVYSIAPKPCRPEQICPENSVGPNLCSAGYYCDAENTYPCPPGAYCPEGTTYPIICGAGFYCPLGSGAMIPCPAGSYSELENIQSADQCLPCPKGYTCPAGTSTPILGNGIKTGDLVAAIVVPILLLIIVLIVFFCCYRKWRQERSSKESIIERPEIGFPRALPQPKRQSSFSSSSSSSSGATMPEQVIRIQESFTQNEKDYSVRHGLEPEPRKWVRLPTRVIQASINNKPRPLMSSASSPTNSTGATEMTDLSKQKGNDSLVASVQDKLQRSNIARARSSSSSSDSSSGSERAKVSALIEFLEKVTKSDQK